MARHLARDKKNYTLLLLYNNYETLPTGKMPKNTQFFRFWVLGGIKEHGVIPINRVLERVFRVRQQSRLSLLEIPDPSLTSDRKPHPGHQLEGHSHDKPDAGNRPGTGDERRN